MVYSSMWKKKEHAALASSLPRVKETRRLQTWVQSLCEHLDMTLQDYRPLYCNSQPVNCLITVWMVGVRFLVGALAILPLLSSL
jgi:hypothetical protein